MEKFLGQNEKLGVKMENWSQNGKLYGPRKILLVSSAQFVLSSFQSKLPVVSAVVVAVAAVVVVYVF